MQTCRVERLIYVDVSQASEKGLIEQEGLELFTLSSAEQLIEQLTTPGTRLVLVDLTCPGISPGEITEAAEKYQPRPRLVGFGPHVQEQLLESARDAGFDQVLGNGEFTSQLAQILSQGTPGTGGSP